MMVFEIHKFLSVYKFYMILIAALLDYTFAICVGLETRSCLENMEENESLEKFNYVLSKYEEIDMKIVGKPLGLRGKRITSGDLVEEHIVFSYQDNTPYDIIQNCVFIISNLPGECESIITHCNTYLARTPRPLLQRKSLAVCEDGVRVVEDDDDNDVSEREATTADPSAELITAADLSST